MGRQMLCILYVIAVSTLLGCAATFIERALPQRWPRRWLWCLTIAASVVIPPVSRANHTSSVTSLFERGAGQPSFGDAFGTLARSALDPAWWARVEGWNTAINRMWIVASLGLIIWGLAGALRVARLVHRARSARSRAGRPTVIDGVQVVVTDALGPATVGLLRSMVLVPRWVLALPGAQRRYVLCHEREHARAHDALTLFVASLSIVLLPWNLALWWQLRRLRLAVEVDCDHRVVATLGDPRSYGELLLRVAEASSQGSRVQPAFLGGVGMLERRLTLLLAPTRLRHIQRFLVPALAIALLFVVLWMPHPVVGHATSEHVTMSHQP